MGGGYPLGGSHHMQGVLVKVRRSKDLLRVGPIIKQGMPAVVLHPILLLFTALPLPQVSSSHRPLPSYRMEIPFKWCRWHA